MSDSAAIDVDSFEDMDLRPGMFLPDGRDLAGQNKEGLWIVFENNDRPECLTWDQAMAQGNLPTREELNLLWENRDQIPGGLEAIGIDTSNESWYWSSTEYSNSTAWLQRFSDGYQNPCMKNCYGRVHCVERLSSDAVLLKMEHY